MKYALVTPPQGFPLIEEARLGYHFVLAQYCEDPTYEQFYRDCHERGHFIMLDNGAAEMGSSISIERIMDVAAKICPDEIVMPDVLDDCQQTLLRTEQALDYVPRKQRAMCPQGKTWKEWEDCADVMVNDLGCTTICVAKRYEKFPGGRAHALRIIMSHFWQHTHTVHLLGCYENPLAEIAAAYRAMPSVRGVDTGAPVAYAQKNVTLDFPTHSSLDWNKEFDLNLARHNVDLYLNAHRGNHAHYD